MKTINFYFNQNNAAPVPPVRNSSMRNCNGSNGNMSAVILDLETRFSDMFHTVKDFPLPIQFCELRKTYNSKNHIKQQINSGWYEYKKPFLLYIRRKR